MRIAGKTFCRPKINEKKAYFRNLHGLKIPKMYSFLVPPFGHTQLTLRLV